AARIDNLADELETAENIAAVKEAAEEGERIPESGLLGPEPMSHAEGKVPARKRPKSEELKTPWSDGRTFPGTPKNAPCPCGSGRKYKMCHGQNEQ
ncbi:SEC-C metal-binding domain-containing protein, partial [Bifidobacterium animalis]|uniref:SEC-C metal-binding domain-containing protein n=1 Tax=Bifidobacterium animalis TaxID=28025 RepID=UPI00201BF17F